MTENFESIYTNNVAIFSEIYDSIDNGDTHTLDFLLKKHTNFIHIPIYGGVGGKKSLLHRAAAKGQIAICQHLLKLGININITDSSAITPLVDAAYSGNMELVKFLHENGASIDGNNLGITSPLIESAKIGHLEMVQYFIKNEADINRLQCKFNQTALDTALIYKNEAISELLKRAGGLRALESIDLATERGSGILESIYNKVGPIISTRPKFSISNTFVELRTSLIGNGKEFKLLFTIGVHEVEPCTEFMICLPFDWPLNGLNLDDNVSYNFPAHFLLEVSRLRLGEEDINEGFLIEKENYKKTESIWPDGIDALITVNYQFPPYQNSTDSEKSVTLLMLTPIKYPKSGRPPEKKLADWIMKQRQASWKKIAIKSS